MTAPARSRWPSLRLLRTAQLVVIWVVVVVFFLAVPGLMGAIPELRTPAEHAVMGLVVSFLFMVAWIVITQAWFESSNWYLMMTLPLGRDQILRALVIERSPLLAVPLVCACSVPLATKGSTPFFTLRRS